MIRNFIDVSQCVQSRPRTKQHPPKKRWNINTLRVWVLNLCYIPKLQLRQNQRPSDSTGDLTHGHPAPTGPTDPDPARTGLAPANPCRSRLEAIGGPTTGAHLCEVMPRSEPSEGRVVFPSSLRKNRGQHIMGQKWIFLGEAAVERSWPHKDFLLFHFNS